MAKDQRHPEDSDDRLIVSSSGLPRRASDISRETLELTHTAVKILGLCKLAGTYTESTGLKQAVMRDKDNEVIMRIIPGPEPGTVELKKE